MIHYLKTREPWFGRIVSGAKTAELRVHDRDFQPGDDMVLVRTEHAVSPTAESLIEYDAEIPQVTVRITHVVDSKQVDGLIDGYCLISFTPHPQPQAGPFLPGSTLATAAGPV